MHLYDLINPDELREQIQLGHVSERHHQTLPLAILNYTARCQWDNDWNDVTRKTRGLIYNLDSGAIVARPFEKFFNLSQHTDEEIPKGRMRVLDKMDGSLGILYSTPEGLAIATRGSFHSDQAEHATRVLRDFLNGVSVVFEPDLTNYTYLFEIIYPANRIVVDYGNMDALVLLDILDIESGNWITFHPMFDSRHYPGLHVLEHEGISGLHELLDRNVDNAEGYVVVFDNNFRVKIKHSEYVRLHRILTNVTARSIFECIAIEDLKRRGFDDKTIGRTVGVGEVEVASFPALGKLLEGVPDEFYTWVHRVVHRLENQYASIDAEVRAEFSKILETLNV